MQDFSVDNASMADFLAVVAKGEAFALYREGKKVAVVTPRENHSEVRSTFAESLAEWRKTREIDTYGLTNKEIDAMRDRSSGPEPLSFE